MAGVEVGQVTLVSGEGKLEVGRGPVRTGVTAIHPRGKASNDPVFAGTFALNGNGEMTGLAWLSESGFLEGPVVLTNTHSVGLARDAVIAWQNRRGAGAQPWGLPVVAETWDGWLNDINGFHVKDAHVFRALDEAQGGPVAEGGVGGGTGMVCFELQGRDRNVVPAARGAARRLHPGRPGAGELRPAAAAHGGGRAGRAGDHGGHVP